MADGALLAEASVIRPRLRGNLRMICAVANLSIAAALLLHASSSWCAESAFDVAGV